jgi:EmrB/QacA subfamily drug resistance transporter
MLITEENRKWWILAAMTSTISMIFVDITVLPVVLPTLQRELLISDLGLQWAINAYTLMLAVLVLAGGKLGDIWGLKKTFCLGVCLFAFASALCGLSDSEWWLILSRGFQGIGGALLIPATQGIIVSHFPPHQRGKALGLFVSIGSIFLALGPLIGGALTSYFSWRYVFWINVPIAGVGLALTFFSVPPMKGKKELFDIRGFIILAIGIASLVFAMMQVQEWGFWSYDILTLLAIGIFSLIILFMRKHKPHASILDFQLMKTKTFIASSSSIFFNQLVIMITVFWAIYFQNILGFSPSKAGMYAFMANIPVLFAAPLGGFLVDRFGPRLPVMAGFGLVFFSLSWFTIFMKHENIWLLLPTLLLFGFGVSLIFTPSYVGMMNEVSVERRGVASGITAALRQFGSTIGLALFGTLYSSIYFEKLNRALQAKQSTMSLTPVEFEGLLAKSPTAMHSMDRLPSGDAIYVFQSAKNAFLDAFSSINLIAAILSFAGIIIAWALLKNQPFHKEQQSVFREEKDQEFARSKEQL